VGEGTFYTHPLLDGTKARNRERPGVSCVTVCVCVCVLLYAVVLEGPISCSFLIGSYYLIPHLSPDLYFPIPTASYPSSSVASPLLLYCLLCASSSSRQVRCRMSPEAVLPPDVLQLAVLLCPAACQVHVRFDCSTPHDVLSPIATALHSLRELSVVCVTSGERSHLNFEDLTAILEHHGSGTLRSLELKVTYPELPTRAVGMFTPVRPRISTRDRETCRGLLPQ